MTGADGSSAYHYDKNEGELYFVAADYRNKDTIDNVYLLKERNGNAMALSSAGSPPAGSPGIFRSTERFEEDSWLLTWLHSDPDADYYYWDYFYDSAGFIHTASLPIELADPALSGTGTLRIAVRGATDAANGDDHEVSATLNGVPLIHG